MDEIDRQLYSLTEAKLKSALIARIRKAEPEWCAYRVENKSGVQSGMPDIQTNGNGRTVHAEVKFISDKNPRLRSRGVQDLEMLKLERATRKAFYVIYVDRKGVKATYIATPTQVDNDDWQSGECMSGLNHDFVVTFLRRMHYNS